MSELLLQRLESRNRAPVGKAYRTRAFVAFAPGTLEASLDVPVGPWACAVRFVREAAGLIELGVVEVGPSG